MKYKRGKNPKSRNGFKKGMKGAFLGHKHSEENKRKIILKNKGNKYHLGKKHSEETRKKMSKAKIGKPSWNKGKEHSKEHKRKMSEARKGKKRPGNPEKWKHSKETKKKMSEAMKGKNNKENNWNWQGGKSFEEYGKDWTDDLKESIRKRDNYICQLCGIHQSELGGFYKKLDTHHIDYDKKNLNPTNLISLCRNCHLKTNYHREYWIKYFTNF